MNWKKALTPPRVITASVALSALVALLIVYVSRPDEPELPYWMQNDSRLVDDVRDRGHDPLDVKGPIITYSDYYSFGPGGPRGICIHFRHHQESASDCWVVVPQHIESCRGDEMHVACPNAPRVANTGYSTSSTSDTWVDDLCSRPGITCGTSTTE